MQSIFILIGILIPIVLCNEDNDRSDIPPGLTSQQGNLWTFSEQSVEEHTAIDRMHRVPASLHNVEFITPARLGRAVRLNGAYQWIAIDNAEMNDCFAFNSQTCLAKDLTLSFWIRMNSGKRIFGTAGYTINEAGPGILFEYDDKEEVMRVEFSNGEHMWRVNIVLKKHRWTNVFAVWTRHKGLSVTLDGHIDDVDLHRRDRLGTPHPINGTTKYSKIVTIGRPANMSKLKEYGQLDLAHLQMYTLEAPENRIRKLPTYMLFKERVENTCCQEKKVYHGCLERACGSPKCLDIEKEFTDCICPKVNVKKCTNKDVFTKDPVATTTLATPEPCAEYRGAFKLQGCKNEYSAPEKPTCNGKLCYYGNCKISNIQHCVCPICDQQGKNLGGMICGSNHQTYESYCVMTKDSCEKKKVIKKLYDGSCKVSALEKALHYWSFQQVKNNDKGFTNKKSKISTDIINKQEAKLQNGVQNIPHDQLGTVLKFDGNQHMIVNKIANPCITNVTCEKGITTSFWMKYRKGDLIFATGGFHGTNGKGPGFQLKRNQKTQIFELQIINNNHIWTLLLRSLPKDWFHFAFTWHQQSGVKLYINGKEKMSQAQYDDSIEEQNSVEKRQSIKPRLMLFDKDLYNELSFAKENNLIRRGDAVGVFELAHVALWNTSLSKQQIYSVYKGEILKTEKQQRCCMTKTKPNPSDKNAKECGYEPQTEDEQCICPEVDDEYDKRCNVFVQQSNWFCQNTKPHCQELKLRQKGFCDNFDIEARRDCAATCSKCTPKLLALMNPQKNFSQETLIFSLLGCIGGLLLLFGTMFYFWKVYRTRYHGHFVPPMKDGASTADVQEYDEEKWTTRYIDSSEYFIKDVPPKKRALPLIPAKNSQVNHRYQPPEFD